jgi:isopentenyl diphosphate isomerase/L-lactate dehydrogenase-like FMN-dependent dehydrogenase
MAASTDCLSALTFKIEGGLWGLASGAQAGVRHVLELLRQEFDLAMALSGCSKVSSITRDLIRQPN